MKRRTFFLLSTVFMSMLLSACNTASPKITGYNIDSENNIIINYDNSSSENVGKITDDKIADLVTSITISSDGYFKVNGVKTSRKVVFSSVSISDRGYYIVDGVETTIKATYGSITISQSGYYIVDGIQTDIAVRYDSVDINEDGYYVVNGIETTIKAKNSYTVAFNTGYSAVVPSQKILEGNKVERPELERTGYILDGWFCNGEEWRFNSDIVLNDMTLKAEWTPKSYTLSFVNEKGFTPSPYTVTFDEQFPLPGVAAVDGYTFMGWYDGDVKYTAGKWTTDSDVTLTAKWSANEYTITLDPGVGSVSETTHKVTYGEEFTLPIPTNDYGVFNGWKVDDEYVTDAEGNSLAPWAFSEDKTLIVDWIIEISTVQDMDLLHTYKNGYFKLNNNINMHGHAWIPVSDFTGKFDGGNHSIIGLEFNITTPTASNSYGLFSSVYNAEICNLCMEDFSFSSVNTSKQMYVGAICGRITALNNEITKIYNCSVNGSMTIASQSSAYPIYAGGLCGLSVNGYFTDCSNSISIPSNCTYSGGITGEVLGTSTFTKCHNNANISAQKNAGGLVGFVTGPGLDAVVFTGCGNEGNVLGTNNAGGLVGNGGMDCTIINSYNHGSIHASTSNSQEGSGGLVGSVYEIGNNFPTITISNSYNSGSVSNTNYAGGLVGVTYSANITRCYNKGSISGQVVGGIGGFCASPTLTECLASGSLSGTLKNTLVYYTSVTSTGCYYSYSDVSSFYRTDGMKISDSSQLTSKTFYKETLFWTEYNPLTKTGKWIFHESGYPTLYFESII